jgi:hypothetical protein
MIITIACLWSIFIGYCLFITPSSVGSTESLGVIWAIDHIPLALKVVWVIGMLPLAGLYKAFEKN